MNKYILLSCFAFTIALTSCQASSDPKTEKVVSVVTTTTQAEEPTDSNSDISYSAFPYDHRKILCILLTNNTDECIDTVNVHTLFLDAGKHPLGTEDCEHSLLMPHCTVIKQISAPDQYASYDIEITTDNNNQAETNYADKLIVSTSKENKNISISISNTSDVIIDETELYIVLYDDKDTAIDIKSQTIYDLYPDENRELSFLILNNDLDHLDVYINKAYPSHSVPKTTSEEPEPETDTTTETTTQVTIVDEPETVKTTLNISQNNALSKAKSYLKYAPFSYSGLIDQLKYEGYSDEDAIYAVDNCNADWNEQAAKAAKRYIDLMSFSRDGLIDQLQHDGYTYDEAVYGVDSVSL